MSLLPLIEQTLKFGAELSFLAFCIYILVIKNRNAGIFLTIYAVQSLFAFMLLHGLLGTKLLEKVFYAGERVNLYLEVFSIIEALTKIGLLYGIYLLVTNRMAKEEVGNAS
jgi:hypothetical protein